MGLGQKITLHLNSQRKLTRELLMGASWQFVRPRGWELGWPRLPRSPPSLPSITVGQSTAGQLGKPYRRSLRPVVEASHREASDQRSRWAGPVTRQHRRYSVPVLGTFWRVPERFWEPSGRFLNRVFTGFFCLLFLYSFFFLFFFFLRFSVSLFHLSIPFSFLFLFFLFMFQVMLGSFKK